MKFTESQIQPAKQFYELCLHLYALIQIEVYASTGVSLLSSSLLEFQICYTGRVGEEVGNFYFNGQPKSLMRIGQKKKQQKKIQNIWSGGKKHYR